MTFDTVGTTGKARAVGRMVSITAAVAAHACAARRMTPTVRRLGPTEPAISMRFPTGLDRPLHTLLYPGRISS
jgi:hypothetical protein